MRDLVFVTGGARSGKSRFAEDLASSRGKPVLYVATAEARDEEMRERIEEHRRRRPENWRTLEARRDVAERLGRSPRAGGQTVLLDCLSLLVSNILLDAVGSLGEGSEAERLAFREVDAELERFLDWLERSAGGGAILVSNEVGWGVVPPHRLGRIYRDLLGRTNQRVALQASEVFLLVSGVPLRLKGNG